MKVGIQFKNNKPIFNVKEREGVVYLEYPLLSDTGIVTHAFSTRIGGVSTGDYTSMNLSFTRGDKEESVRENFRRISRAIGVDECDMVFSKQTHTTNVRVVTQDDRGKGLVDPLDYENVDGLITNVPGICLATFYADCVPIYLIDPVNKAIGLSHSGWRGTVGKIGKVTLECMNQQYGTNAKDIVAAIGPSICKECYEVSEDVIIEFQKNYDQAEWEALFFQKENGKFQLDLWKANEIVLLDAGVPKDHIAVTNICTCCNENTFFSHRATRGKRGNLGAFLALNVEEKGGCV
ncbi:peptidoglycan editing factor PgeF [Lachnospiraceae bacterium LCP25S3_G4]